MRVITATNVNDALWKMLKLLNEGGQLQSSRAGEVLVYPTPVTTIYLNPQQRVLTSVERDANPFFHLMEALWMLNGQDDLETVEYFNRRMRDFSDDGETLHGAYGRRWRRWFGRDQLLQVIELLKRHPTSRRAVIQMWDALDDLSTDEAKKDVPCNLVITPLLIERQDGRELDMTVFCRSNDAIWGAAGANAVHFSILQEYLARNLLVPVGRLYQISNNFHVYNDVFSELKATGYLERPAITPYVNLRYDVIVGDANSFDIELELFSEFARARRSDKDWTEIQHWHNRFFPDVALPMVEAYRVFRSSGGEERYLVMQNILLRDLTNNLPRSDWLYAARQWTERRKRDFLKKGQDVENAPDV
jgi:thymidylate synthase